jgi:type IV pilus assembly protein PilO
MNFNILWQNIKARQKSFICIFILITINIGLYIYSSAYLEPNVAAGGTVLDAASIYRQGKGDLAAWRGRIYPKKDFARFIGDLFETATNNTLAVGTITYKAEPIRDENILAYSIGFNVSGKYAAIKSFIADIERLRAIAVINNISLNGKAAEDSVDMKLQLTAFFRVEGK